jgi:multidrug efflux pump
MTSRADSLVELALWSWRGVGARALLLSGLGVTCGTLAATFLAIFFVPLFYRVIVERKLIERRSHDELLDEVKHLRNVAHLTPHTPSHRPLAAHGDDHA